MSRSPSLFISHGAPTYALEPGEPGRQLTLLGQRLLRPEAVLVISPHWFTHQVTVTATAVPETIHDFGGFSEELYEIRYPARGQASLAQAAVELLIQDGYQARLDEQRGMDHGAWVPLMHLFPMADVPVIQVSIPFGTDALAAWQLGQALAPLAERGVLIIGSGSLTHNLREYRQDQREALPYVREFAAWVRHAVVTHDSERLIKALLEAPHAERAHPTSEHFLPLLIAAGAADLQAPVEVLSEGVAYGAISMESYLFGTTH